MPSPANSLPQHIADIRGLPSTILLTLARRNCFAVQAPSQALDLDVRLGSRSPVFVQAMKYKRFGALSVLTVSNSKPVEACRIATEYFFPTGLLCGRVLGISVVIFNCSLYKALGVRIGVLLAHGPGILTEAHGANCDSTGADGLYAIA